MRRIVHRVLAAALALALLGALHAPLVAMAAAAKAPMCCLAKGEHKCLMNGMPSSDGKPAARAANSGDPCPYALLALAALNAPALAPPASAHALSAPESQTRLLAAAAPLAARSAAREHSERGPPASLA